MQVSISSLSNSVNGTTRNWNNASHGRETHARQVGPDRYPMTALKNRNEIKVATWKVCTLYQSGKLENLKREAMRYNIAIL